MVAVGGGSGGPEMSRGRARKSRILMEKCPKRTEFGKNLSPFWRSRFSISMFLK
jgi:hypothetical protein